MNVLLFSGKSAEIGKRLKAVIETLIPTDLLECHGTVTDLTNRLQSHLPERDKTIIITNVSDDNELESLVTIRDLLDGTRVILILPDRQTETIRKGLSLYPRFVTYSDSDFVAFITVLNNMLRNLGFSQPLNRLDTPVSRNCNQGIMP